jgi:flagellar assembly protein FliH
MSTKATRLQPTVPTDRFHWQRRGNPLPAESTTVRPVFPPSEKPDPQAIAPALRDLPSPTADRLLAVEQEAHARGYDEGRREGIQSMIARTDEALARLADTIEEVRALRVGVLHRTEREAVQLALSIAHQVLHRAVDGDVMQLVALAQQTIDRLGATIATIHLNPEDFGFVAAGVTPTLGSGVELAVDPTLPRGGCLVKSSFGVIDVSIDAQVREIARALLEGRDE